MSDTDLILTRYFAASPARVWRCWTEPELLKQWFAPKPVVITEMVVDLKPGGRFFSLMQLPDGTAFPNEGCLLLIEPETRLIFTECLTGGFRPAANPMISMTAEITFAPEGTGTRYTARAMHPDAQTRQRHEDMGFHDGWGTAADQLEEFALKLGQ